MRLLLTHQRELAEITVTPVGGIKTIRVTSEGEGFKVLPRVWVRSRGGVGVFLSNFEIDRVSAERLKEPMPKKLFKSQMVGQTGLLMARVKFKRTHILLDKALMM